MLLHSKKRIAKSRRGTTAIEIAIVLPILVMLLFGAIDFSRANTIRNTAENAAYEAARRAIVPGATSAEVQSSANAILSILSINNASVTVTPAVITNATRRVKVTVSVPLGSNLYASSQLLAGTTISKSCELTREQFSSSAP